MKIINSFKALSDETRLRIFNLLLNHELNVNEIVAVLKMGQSRISRHLKILADSGLVKIRRDGLWAFYSALANGDSKAVADICLDAVKNEPLCLDDLKSLEKFILDRGERRREFFNSIAGEISEIKRDILGDIPLNDIIAELIGEENSVADLGCGNGDLLKILVSKGKNVIGVDRSPVMLKEAEKKLKGIKSGLYDLRLGEIEHLPIRENESGSAVLSMVLHYVDRPAMAIEECARVIKSGGLLLVADIGAHGNESLRHDYGHKWLGFDENLIISWIESAGFEIKEVQRLKGAMGLDINIFKGVKIP
jgi:ArsR family transcriptional regulator